MQANRLSGEGSDNYIEKLRTTISIYHAAIKGHVEVHYWSSPECEIMATRYGVTVDDSDIDTSPPNMPDNFIAATQTTYSGVMSPQMLQRRIAELTSHDPDYTQE